MIVTKEVKAEAKAMHQNGASLEDIMQHLHDQGITLLGTIAVVHSLLPKPSLTDARKTVLNSTAWSNYKESFYEFQDIFWNAMNKTDDETEISA